MNHAKSVISKHRIKKQIKQQDRIYFVSLLNTILGNKVSCQSPNDSAEHKKQSIFPTSNSNSSVRTSALSG